MQSSAKHVSRETHRPARQYSQRRGDATRERLVEAVIAYAREGRYRASARQLAQHAGVHHSAVSRHYGHVRLLYRVVAREHWSRVSLPVPGAMVHERKALVWAVLVGEPRDGR
jgi:AcrR family transcriptional regulator